LFNLNIGKGWLKVAPLLVDRKPQVFSHEVKKHSQTEQVALRRVSKEFIVKIAKEAFPLLYHSTF
jgi:hypothetical protein